MEVQALYELSLHTINRFRKLNPREWGINGTIIELMGEIGSLSHCTMLYERFKVGNININKIKDEVSDVLFIIFSLADVCKIEMPKQICAQPDKASFAELTIKLGGNLGLLIDQLDKFKNNIENNTIKLKIESNLVDMICILERIANNLNFSLEDAHRTELKIAELWLDTKLDKKTGIRKIIKKTSFYIACAKRYLGLT